MNNPKTALLFILAVLLIPISGCSTTANRETDMLGPDIDNDQLTYDPFEKYNRYMYRFNTDLDNKILLPLARSYRKNVHRNIRTGIWNFFANAAEGRNMINSLLQGKVQQAVDSFSRMFINTMFGFGFFDVATQSGLERRIEDIGQTLAVWGFGPGPYVILPVLGPSNGRDLFGLYSYFYYTDPLGYIDDSTARFSMLIIDLVDTRSRYLQAASVFDFAALDPYIFAREGYYQAREDMIHDGKPPVSPDR
jgi:phospholipid-binding lipoprotein MlaA